MDRTELKAYCLAKPGAGIDYPFDATTALVRVGGHMFALVDDVAERPFVNLKCPPELSVDLRASFAGIRPGYHMNKEHWNSVDLDGSVPDELIRELVDRSYALVESGLTATERERAGLPPRSRR